MNAAVKEKWLAALESGDYPQGKFALKEAQNGVVSYCCLGVLCEVAVAEGVISEAAPREDSPTYIFNGSTAYLPTKVMEWAGLTSHAGDLEEENVCLTRLNDNGVPFAEIAEVIREKF